MFDLLDIFTILNLIFPVVVIFGAIIRYKYTGRTGVLIIIPAFLYIFVFYAIVIYLEFHTDNYDPGIFREWFRAGLTLVMVAVSVSQYTDIVILKRMINGGQGPKNGK